jgi:CRP-like cAMP-binding protein
MESTITPAFDVPGLLETTGTARTLTEYRRGDIVFAQGDRSDDVCYIQRGRIRLSVISRTGRQGIVAMLGPGQFFGEGGLAGQSARSATAIATTDSAILAIERDAMMRLVHAEPAMADRFIAHLLARNSRIEEDLIDQLFNCSEKRLARTLMLLAPAPHISQETLAEMVGTTRSRVNFFMKKFERMGFIDYRNGIKVNDSLRSVVLPD